MKNILAIFFSLFLFQTNLILAQDSIPETETAFLRPESFDSTRTLERQYTEETRLQFIGLQLYLPEIFNPSDGPIIFSENKNDDSLKKGNRYFTVTDVLPGDSANVIQRKKLTSLCGSRYKNTDSLFLNDLIMLAVFVLHDNKDTVNNPPYYWIACLAKKKPYSCSYYNTFIPLPYFEKQKQIYAQKKIIFLSDKSNWLCTDVTLRKSADPNSQDSILNIFCHLKNDNGSELFEPIPSDKYIKFMTEERYNWLMHADRGKKERMLKEIEETQKELIADCISKFGPHYGTLIAQQKIETGMTSEMCRTAWGDPWKIIKTLPDTEKWYYSENYNLCFKDKLLQKIEN